MDADAGATNAAAFGLAARRDQRRALILAPTLRDAGVTRTLLEAANVEAVVCANAQALTVEIGNGADVLVLTDVALTDPAFGEAVAALRRQPSWSDVPTVLLAPERARFAPGTGPLGELTNVTLLERPCSTRSLVSAVQAALRARQRQYQLRDQLEELTRVESALRDADRRKDEFLATLAHELRNPLAPIRTGLQLLARAPTGSAHAERAHAMMDRQLAQLIRLIDDLLDVSRISSGKIVLRRERFDLRQAVESAIESTQPMIDAAGHTMQVALPKTPVHVIGDPSRLAQVVGNLLNNAVKYTPRKGRIRVTLVREGDEAVVRVSDDGAGVPPEMLSRIFEMFTQVNRTLDRAQGGLGIGLSLVRRLMELHGGTALAESAGSDRGSTFSIRLPMLSSSVCRTEGAVPVVSNGTVPRRRVLLVDDNVDAADALAMLLEIAGHTVRTETGGAAGLQAVEEFRPDVVFCDIGLPGMDGHQVARQLRADARYASMLLVALTGWGSEDDKRLAREAGFDLHLTKPVSVDAVEAILQRF